MTDYKQFLSSKSKKRKEYYKAKSKQNLKSLSTSSLNLIERIEAGEILEEKNLADEKLSTTLKIITGICLVIGLVYGFLELIIKLVK